MRSALFIKELPQGWLDEWREALKNIDPKAKIIFSPYEEKTVMIHNEPLYKVAHRYQQAYEALFLMEDMPEEAITDTLAGIEGEFTDKAINIAALIKNIEAQAAQVKEAERSMNERKKALENHAKRLRDYLLENIKCLPDDKQKIFTPEFQISLKNNPAAVFIEDGIKLADEYLRIIPEEREPDKKKLKEALDNGVVIDGVKLVKGISLVIK